MQSEGNEITLTETSTCQLYYVRLCCYRTSVMFLFSCTLLTISFTKIFTVTLFDLTLHTNYAYITHTNQLDGNTDYCMLGII